jgi:Uma2 family endonuclease
MEARQLRRMSVEEYVAFDRSDERKWEYVNGEAFAMAGSSPRHGAIVTNLVVALAGKLRGAPCFPLVDGQKVETAATRAFHYPDITVVCGKPRYGAKDEHALTNPTILVEVLSPTTADYDRGAKFDHYKTIPELREYVVVFAEERRVEHRKRVGQAQWLTTDLIAGEIALESAGIALSLDEIYADLERVEP